METRSRPTTQTSSKTPLMPRLRWPVSERFQAIAEPTESEAVSRRLAPRQAHSEHRALTRLARHGHIAAHHTGELARDGETEPRAAEALRGRGISLAELLEQLCLLLGSHAYTGVGDGQLNPVATVGDPARPQPDLAFFGELAGIAEQIEQDLPQPHGVDCQCAEVLLGVNDDAVLVLLGKLPGGADDLIDQRCELHGLRIELKLSGLDLREVEYLVDKPEQVST